MNNIVLIHPVIPQNTGNIMRTCVATDTKLHLIKPIGFSLSDKAMKRAGLDYIKDLSMEVHESFDDFLAKEKGSFHFFTRYAKVTYSDADYREGDQYLFFGHEHDGIPKGILVNFYDNCVRIPMYKDTRSLNLSNCAAIGIYEALRQQGFPDLSRTEVQKGEDYLLNDSYMC